ncbi:hypothetical protein F511_18607 [Dorcoceras hygrometricum]|uniref:Uncharacterized protein n=1 Tax=Dorcoceras hygrometricum TaxID=472368 RepID=A0A2Z7A5J7_9LAMI|nr:hypothetical protein F511_18607 [Dorcoceras hygrometricum]
MKVLYSASEAPFKHSNKKNDMKVEYRLLHDIVAKSLSAKAGSFDVVTTEKFEMMVAITAGLKVNWAHVLFKTLVAMVSSPGKQSPGNTVPLSILLEKLVKADLGVSVDLNLLKVLNHNSVLTYMKKNQAASQAGEGSKTSGDKTVVEPKLEKVEKNKKEIVMTSLDGDMCPLATLGVGKTGEAGAKHKLVIAPFDSEATLPLLEIKKKQRTKRPKPINPTVYDQAETTPAPVPVIPAEAEGVSTSVAQEKDVGRRVSAGSFAFSPMEIREIRDGNFPRGFGGPRGKPETGRTLEFEHRAQADEQPAQQEEMTMIEQQAQDHVEELSLVVQNVEGSEAADSVEHQAQEEERQAPEAEQPVVHQDQAGSSPSSPKNSSFSVHYSDSVTNNEYHQDPVSSNLHMVQYTEHRDNSEEEEDFAQAGPQPFNFSSPPEDFDVVSELKTVKRVVESLESKGDMTRDDRAYMKHNSNIFRRAFYKKMDEVVTSVNTSQTVMETNLVRQFTESQQHLASDLDFIKLHLA